MIGILMSILGGVCMSLQGVFNTALSKKIGSFETNAIVQGSGLILTVILLLLFGKGNFKNIRGVNKLYLLGGILGVVIIFTVIEGISKLGPTYSISTILIAQLTAAGIIDSFGLFETAQNKFALNEYLGIAVMIAGVVLFKWK